MDSPRQYQSLIAGSDWQFKTITSLPPKQFSCRHNPGRLESVGVPSTTSAGKGAGALSCAQVQMVFIKRQRDSIRSSSELGGAVRAVRSSQGMSLKVTLAWFRRVRQFLKARSGSLPFVAIGEAEWELRVTEDPKDRQGSDRPFPARWRRWRVQVSRRSWRLPRPPSRRRMRAIRFPLLHCHLRHPQHRTPGADGYFWQRRWLA